MALTAVVLSVNFIACSDDDDSSTSSIVGKWKYTIEDDEEPESGYFTFQSNGKLIWEEYDNYDSTWEETNNNTYTLTGDNLKIIFNDNDDYTTGTITFSDNNNKATYKYTWHDCDGEWDDDTVYTMTLTRQE